MADMEPVDSSYLHSVGYDPTVPGIVIKFQDGRTHGYPGTTEADLAALKAAPSAGKHFHRHLKNRQHVKL